MNDQNDGIVRFDDLRKQRVYPEIARIEAYWESLRRGRLVPLRSDVDPRGLTGVLENAFVLERIAPGIARFRVAGSRFTNLMGMEVRGMPISAAFTAAGRTRLSEALEAVFSEPACVTLECTAEAGIGRPPLTVRLAFFPLRCDMGQVSRVLGAISIEGDIGRTPRRLTVASLDHRTLTGYAEAPIVPTRPTPRASRSTGFAEPVSPYRAPEVHPATRLKSERPYLRLVKTE